MTENAAASPVSADTPDWLMVLILQAFERTSPTPENPPSPSSELS
jgi:hypothetical protein